MEKSIYPILKGKIMNPLVSTPGSEYVCPSCGKKSKLPLDVPQYGLFKVACFYCKYISEVKFEVKDEAEAPASLPAEDLMHPMPDELNQPQDISEQAPEFTFDNQEDISAVEEEKDNLTDIPDYIYQPTEPEPDTNFAHPLDNPIDNPMDIAIEEEEAKLEPDTTAEDQKPVQSPVPTPVEPDDSKPEAEAKTIQQPENALSKPSMALVEYRHIEFSNSLFKKIARALSIEKIAVTGDQYVPIFEKKTVKQ